MRTVFSSQNGSLNNQNLQYTAVPATYSPPAQPHPEPFYIFTETICPELPQPDSPYQHHSELHGDKALAPAEGRGAGSAGL